MLLHCIMLVPLGVPETPAPAPKVKVFVPSTITPFVKVSVAFTVVLPLGVLLPPPDTVKLE